MSVTVSLRWQRRPAPPRRISNNPSTRDRANQGRPAHGQARPLRNCVHTCVHTCLQYEMLSIMNRNIQGAKQASTQTRKTSLKPPTSIVISQLQWLLTSRRSMSLSTQMYARWHACTADQARATQVGSVRGLPNPGSAASRGRNHDASRRSRSRYGQRFHRGSCPCKTARLHAAGNVADQDVRVSSRRRVAVKQLINECTWLRRAHHHDSPTRGFVHRCHEAQPIGAHRWAKAPVVVVAHALIGLGQAVIRNGGLFA